MFRTALSTGKRGLSVFSRSLVNVSRTGANDSIAVMELNSPPVNALSLELLTAMSEKLTEVNKDTSVRGLILTSTKPGIFSAGLDIMEMYNPKEERLRSFWRTLQEVYLQLYGSRLATSAAIKGHSPAGGCLLSLCCDTRVMAEGKFTIGLNETKLGIVAPFWFINAMVNVIGTHQADRMLQLGQLIPGDKAKQIGLVDEVVPVDKVVETAALTLEPYLKIDDNARKTTKLLIRERALTELASKRDKDIDQFVATVMHPKIQKGLGLYLQSLKK